MATQSTAAQVIMIADLWGLPQSAVSEKLLQLKSLIRDTSDEILLDYLLKYDLNIEKAVNLHFNQLVKPTQSLQSERKNKPNTNRNPVKPNTSENEKPTRSICGSSMSPFLIDNHIRHCAKDYKKQQEKQKNELKAAAIAMEEKESELMQNYHQRNEPYEPVEDKMIGCRFCEFQCIAIHDHEYQCGARTDLCELCGKRDTLRNLTDKIHKCHDQTHTNQVQDYRSFGMDFHDQVWR
eukprot:UN05253